MSNFSLLKKLKTLVELWRLNRTWRNTLREYIFLSKNVRIVAMYHQNKFQVCISKNNECRAKKRRLTFYLNMRSEQTHRHTDTQTHRHTDRHVREGWNIDIWSIWNDIRTGKIFLKHDLYDQTWQKHNAHGSQRSMSIKIIYKSTPRVSGKSLFLRATSIADKAGFSQQSSKSLQ